MAFFKSHGSRKHNNEAQRIFEGLDWSKDLARNGNNYFSAVKSFEFGLPATISAIAHNPVQSLLAVGTLKGSLHVYGSPGVNLSWTNSPAHSIKFLLFKPGTPLICCVDSKDTLFGYDLSQTQGGIPHRAFTFSLRSVVMAMVISPAHSHIFLGLKDGTVDCFDSERGVLSPYRIRNLWAEREELLRRSCISPAPSRRHIPICTDIKLHPFDLNLLLIAHEGGISLYDLKTETTIRSYQLILPPGAIGSCCDPSDTAIFEERRPSVTCICFRPDGQMFVSGHSDGCMAFWSIEDGDIPILVRTVDLEDAMAVKWAVFDPDRPDLTGVSTVGMKPTEEKLEHEPIFRLAWSHFSEEGRFSPLKAPASPKADGGREESMSQLTVLGGLKSGDPIGIHVFHLPNLNSNQQATTPLTTETLKASVLAIGHSVYFTQHVPEDFLLLPRKSPYFDNSFNAMAIIIITNSPSESSDLFSIPDSNSPPDTPTSFSSRTLNAFSFPPSTSEEPSKYFLPAPLDWIGIRSVLIAQVFEVQSDLYRQLVSFQQSESMKCSKKSLGSGRIPLNGGFSKVSSLIHSAFEKEHQSALSLIEEFSQQYRILVTIHIDQKIRFWDVTLSSSFLKEFSPTSPHRIDGDGSPSYLSSDIELGSEFPSQLNHLTIDLAKTLSQISDIHGRSGKLDPIGVQLCGKSLDLLITFSQENFILYSFQKAAQAPPQKDGDGISKSGNDVLLPLDLAEGQFSTAEELKESKKAPLPTAAEQTQGSVKQTITSDSKVKGLEEAVKSPSHSAQNVSATHKILKSLHSPVPVSLEIQAQQHKQEKCNFSKPLILDLTTFQDVSSTFGGFFPATLVVLSDKGQSSHHNSKKSVEESPYLKRGPITSISDLGFLAAIPSERDRVVLIDLGKRQVLINDCLHQEEKHKTKRKEPSRIGCLGWSMAEMENDNSKLPLLLIGYDDGTFQAIKLQYSHCASVDNWTALHSKAHSFELDYPSKTSFPDNPVAVFTFDHKGNPITVDLKVPRSTLAETASSIGSTGEVAKEKLPGEMLNSVVVIVTSSSIFVRLNINGPQVLQKTGISDQAITKAAVFSTQGCFSLLLIDKKRTCFVLGLPQLEVIWKSPLPHSDWETPRGLSVDSSADILENFSPTSTTLTTLLYGRDLIYFPQIVAYNPKINNPELPQMKTSAFLAASTLTQNFVSWLQGNSQANQSSASHGARITGAELDQILAGPLRPEKAKALQPPRLNQGGKSASFIPVSKNSKANANKGAGRSSSEITAQGLSLGNQLNQNIDHLNERGERLKQLNERFDDMSQAANDLVHQAKKISQQQASKAAFSNGLSGMKSFFKS